MPYCTATDVRNLIQSDKSDTQIGSLITDSDGDLDELLDGATMSTDSKRKCSARLVAIVLAQEQRGVFAEHQSDNTASIQEWQSYVNGKVQRAKGRWFTVDPLAT